MILKTNAALKEKKAITKYEKAYSEVLEIADIAHKFTFEIDTFFEKFYEYEKRLKIFEKFWIPKVKNLRKFFYEKYLSDHFFRNAFFDYMEKELDFLFYVNILVSAPDQRKFDSDTLGYIPFTAYPYQVVDWELSRIYSLAMWKSRDMGASFTLDSGYAMNLTFLQNFEAIFLSRVEKDVDMAGDRTQTNMGRIRQIIESTNIFTIENFKKDTVLTLQKTDKVKIVGESSSRHAARQKRTQEAWLDEAGANPNLKGIKQSITSSAKRVHYTGTLEPSTDGPFRDIIKEAIFIDWRAVYDEFKRNILENRFGYRDSWKKAIKNVVKPQIGENRKGAVITMLHKYTDHPLKKGNSDFRTIECNRLYNDPVIIAHELDADLNAGSPDRSLYGLQNEHFISKRDWDILVESEDFKYMKLYAGFDPGGHGNAAMVISLVDKFGFCYTFPEIRFEKGNAELWIEGIINNYCKKYNKTMTIFADEAINQYKDEGWLWNSFIYKGFYSHWLNIIPVNNGKISSRLFVANKVLQDRVKNHPLFEGENLPKIYLHEDNRVWGMKFIANGKYSDDKEQKRISHPAEAWVYFLSSLYEDNFVDNRVLLG